MNLSQVVALDADGSAEGELYLDDGRSFAFQRGASLHRRFSFARGKLSSAPAEAAGGAALTLPLSGEPFRTDVVVERIVVLGLTGDPAGWKVQCVVPCRVSSTGLHEWLHSQWSQP